MHTVNTHTHTYTNTQRERDTRGPSEMNSLMWLEGRGRYSITLPNKERGVTVLVVRICRSDSRANSP